MAPTRVLITGAYGLIGNVLYRHLAQQPDTYTVFGLDRRTPDEGPYSPVPEQGAGKGERPRFFLPESPQPARIPAAQFVQADLSDIPTLQAAFEGMDVVVHLAADATGMQGWESLLESNLIGAYNAFEAARLAGVRRMVHASTNQVGFGYLFEGGEWWRGALQAEAGAVSERDPVRPPNLYAGTKVWAEALGTIYAHSHGMSVISLRIGWVTPTDRPLFRGMTPLWCSRRDIVRAITLSIDAPPDLRHDVFYIASDNAAGPFDLTHAREVLGYVPQDSAEDYHDIPEAPPWLQALRAGLLGGKEEG